MAFKRSSASKEEHKGRWCQRGELENDEERRDTGTGLKGSTSGTNVGKGGERVRKEGARGVGQAAM